MKKNRKIILGNEGMVLFVTLVVVLSISALSVGMITSSYLSKTVAENYREKIESFYAADGQMTLLAQEVLDSNAYKYCTPLPHGGSEDTSTASNVIINNFNNSTDWGNNLTTPDHRDIIEKISFINTNMEGGENVYLAMNGSYSQLGMAVEGLSEGGEIRIRIKSDNMTADKIEASLYSLGVNEGVYLNNYGTIASGYSDITIPLSDFSPLGVDVSNATAFYLDFYPENSLKEVRIDHIEATGVSSGGGGGVDTSDTLIDVSGFPATSSTEMQPASRAFDQNTNTRWESEHGVDPQWLKIDLETEHNIAGVVIDWEAASASDYEIQGSNDGNNWTTLTQQTDLPSQQHRIDSLDFDPGMYRYVRMYGTERSLGYGYSIFEMRLYAAPQAVGDMAVDTVQFSDDFSVEWKMQEVQPYCYNLATQSFTENSGGRIVFRTPLKQYVEVASSEIFNPWDETALVPVTFYDFHSNRTNPEFEQPHKDMRHYGMVADTLDKDRKPMLGPSPNVNHYIKYWFRPWADSAKGDSTIPVYRYTTMDLPLSLGHKFRRWTIPEPDLDWGHCDCNEYWSDNPLDTIITLDSASIAGSNLPRADKAFENVVIHDTLQFQLIDSATGTYHFEDNNFFRLDSMGFGIEWNQQRELMGYSTLNHNYSFTMEIKRQFVMVPGLFFVFEGDDDVWTFIDNRLVMDIGGIHHAIKDSVGLDTIPDLENKKLYNFDFFYCERHSAESHIKITTNLLEYRPPTTKRRHWKRDYGMID